MIRVEVLNAKRDERTTVELADLDHIIANADNLVWVDLEDPNQLDLDLIAEEFAFHPLAIEDSQHPHERPKIDHYETYLFMVFYALRGGHDGLVFTRQELALFIGPNYLVSIHDGPVPEIESTARRWAENTAGLGSRPVAVLVYSLLDAIVDNYFPILDAVAERADALENAIFDRVNHQALEDIFRLRKALLGLRRVLAPERDVLNTLTRRDIELLGPETAIYFQDVYDHVLRVTDAVDTYRDLLSSSLEAYLSAASNNLNQVMRTLTAWSIILMSLSLIAGIYGMNFENMPELRLSWGYYAALVGMAVIGFSLFLWFKRNRWL